MEQAAEKTEQTAEKAENDSPKKEAAERKAFNMETIKGGGGDAARVFAVRKAMGLGC
jgi:hypothetical protein